MSLQSGIKLLLDERIRINIHLYGGRFRVTFCGTVCSYYHHIFVLSRRVYNIHKYSVIIYDEKDWC